MKHGWMIGLLLFAVVGCGNSPWGLYLAALAVHTHQEIQGEQGPAGLDGVDGEKGETGEQGIPGLDGNDGPVGPQGSPGADGADGKDANGDECTKVKLCHNNQTIEICESALQAHLGHGDTQGPCVED